MAAKSIVGGLLQLRTATTSLRNPAAWLFDMLGGSETKAGVRVGPDSALRVGAVWSCIRNLSEDVGSLPTFTYERKDRGRELAQDFSLYRLLHDAPNPEMDAVTFKTTLQGHIEGWGNGFAEIELAPNGDFVAFWPLLPDRTAAFRKDGRIWYRTRVKRQDDKELILPADRVLHVKSFSSDGYNGIPPIRHHREAIGLTAALEEHAARFFGNNATPASALLLKKELSEPAQKRLRTDFEEMYGGLENRHRFAILEEGMSIEQLGLPNDVAQFIESRAFQVQEIARIFRVPPHKVGDLSRATFTNIEHQSIEYVVDSIRPRVIRWEAAIHRHLTPAEQRRYYVKFNVDALLRGDQTSRYAAYHTAVGDGWLNADEIRELEDRNPIGGKHGGTYYVPLNWVPAEQQLEAGDTSVPPAARSIAAESRSRAARRRIARAYRRIFADALTRILRRERADVLREAERLLRRGERDALREWIAAFYLEHADYAERAFAPALLALAEAIGGEAAAEVGLSETMTPEYETFVRAYGRDLSARHCEQQAAAVQIVVDQSTESLDALREQFDAWERERPGAFADSETLTAANAFASEIYRVAGLSPTNDARVSSN